jgi:hypothetical protein
MGSAKMKSILIWVVFALKKSLNFHEYNTQSSLAISQQASVPPIFDSPVVADLSWYEDARRKRMG